MTSYFSERGVICIYAFYVDVFFVQNFCMNEMVLFLAALFRKNKKAMGIKRMAVGALCGTLLELTALLLLRNYAWFLAVSGLFILPVMTIMVFGKKEPKALAADYLTCLLITVLLGGMTAALENLTGIRSMILLTGSVSFLLIWAGIRFLYRQLQIQTYLYEVLLENAGCSFEGKGLLDTGNVLTDPVSRRPVHIIGKAVAEQLGLGSGPPDLVIPFTTLGKEDGLLEGYTLEHMTVWRGRKKEVYAGVLTGVAPESLLVEKEYQVILNGSIFETVGDRN